MSLSGSESSGDKPDDDLYTQPENRGFSEQGSASEGFSNQKMRAGHQQNVGGVGGLGKTLDYLRHAAENIDLNASLLKRLFE